MPKIFIQGENAASVARAYVFGNNSTVAGSDARGIAATSNLSGSNRQRQAALARAYDAATEPAAKQAALDGIAFYAFQQAVVTAQRSGDSDNYEIERPADYAQYAQQALATARGYAAEEASQAREAQTVRARAAEQTRLANRAPQARALDDRFGEDTGRGRISAQSERGQAMAVLNQYFNTLPANITGDVRYNRARNGIDNELERVDTSMWNSSARENALRSARSILDSQQELERTQAATRPPAAPAAVTGNSEHVPLHGSPNNHYGQSVNIGNPVTARNTARVAILSAGFGDNNSQHFNSAQVNAILADIDPQEQYTNAQLRNLHDQREAAPDQASKNNFTAVIGVLTLENRFARARAEDRTSLTMFGNNQEVVSFYQNALRQAGTYAADDQTVAAAPTAGGGQSGEAAGTSATGAQATRSGLRVYGRRDGTPAPNPEEVPNLRDEEQVRELQRSLGLTGTDVDGLYGPQTHALMLAAAQRQNKPPREFDFTAQGIFDAFVAALTGAGAGEGQTTGGADTVVGGAASLTAATAATSATPGADVAARAMASNLQNDVGADSASPGEQADDYSAYVSSKEQAVSMLRQHLNLTLTPEQVGRLTVQNGRIHSPDILRLEQALNAVRGDARAFEENGNFDSRLRRIMQTEGMSAFVGAIFSGTASTADNQAPGVTGGNGAGGQVTTR